MSSFTFGIRSTFVTNSPLTNQNIIGTVNIGDPVFFSSTQWDKADINNLPTGVYQGGASGSATVILSGILTSGSLSLVADQFYYLDLLTGGLTTNLSEVKIGKSISSTQLLVDIDISSIKVKNRIAGYVTAGSGSARQTERVLFSNDINSSVVSTANTGHRDGASFNSEASGYVGGGTNTTGSAVHSSFERLNFTDDTWFNLTTFTGIISSEFYSSCESRVSGYISQGAIPAVSTIAKFDFSTETNDQTATVLTDSRRSTRQSSYNSFINGYFPGGNVSAASISSIIKLIFSIDISSNLISNLSSAKEDAFGYESKDAGYVAYGNLDSSSVSVETLDKLLFSVETNNNLSTTFGSRESGAAFNSSVGGYNSEGTKRIPPPAVSVSITDRLNFADDTPSVHILDMGLPQRGPIGFEN